MISKLRRNIPLLIKLLLVAAIILLTILSLSSFNNSERVKTAQAIQAQRSVAAHTQTLNEIQLAVNELKASNQADHAQTVKYINCVLVGIANSPTQSQELAVYQQCLENSGAN